MNGSRNRGYMHQNGGPYTSPTTNRGNYNSGGRYDNVSPTRSNGPYISNRSPSRTSGPNINRPSSKDESAIKNRNNSPNRVRPSASFTDREEKPGCLKRFSNRIIGTLESGFYRLGKAIGTHPVKFIIGCFIFAGLCGIGIALAFTQTTDTRKLWSGTDSEVIRNFDQVTEWFPSETRFATLIVKAVNILTPTEIQNMYVFYDKSVTMTTAGGIKLEDVCVKFGAICSVSSILELWSYNGTVINSLSQQSILDTINTVTISPVFNNAYDVTTILGGITRNETGSIIGATAIKLSWLLQGKVTMKDSSMEWEAAFIELAKKEENLNVYVYSSRSFADEAGKSIQADITLLSTGYGILILYVAVVLGRFNAVEQGIYLAFSGILCCGLSICVSFGLASAFGLEYGPLHSILPFLLLGIGVDDMFVIMGALNNLNPDEAELEIPEKIGRVLKHAGLSVTVTSLTDMVAFGVGASTVLPGLRSFCGFAALGILGLFIFQVVFFTATLAIDQRRRTAARNACCCCYVHKDYTPRSCSQKDLLSLFFRKYFAPLLMKLPVKIVLFVLTLGIFGVNMYGVISLKQEFYPSWFLPQDSYAFKYLQESGKLLPDDGREGAVYCGNIDYFGSKTKFELLDSKLNAYENNAKGTIDSWFKIYTEFLQTTSNPMFTGSIDANKYPNDEASFTDLFYKYILTEQRRLLRLMKFHNTTGGDLLASQISFKLKKIEGSADQIAAMDSVRQIVLEAGFSGDECFAYSRHFINWETNKVIQSELYRNLGLAFACVFVVTLILIANLWTCLMVSSCIILTLVNVGGSMHFWGLTIDIVTGVLLILAIGLTVDYSAHVGHTFMTIQGTRKERALETLSIIGPPVFNGGFSTFLAFVLLSGSNSYVFSVFFKVFLLVVLYGLFHGLVYLPIILSWIGPDPYLSADHTYHSKMPPTGDHVAHARGNDVAMTSSSKQAYTHNGYITNQDPDYDIETIYIPPPDYTPPTIRKHGLPRIII